MDLELGPLTRADVPDVGSWAYPPPYDAYDVSSADAEAMLDPETRYSAVRLGGELIAYVCLGSEARVKGLGAEADTEDLGFGLRPDLVGKGLSREVLPWLLSAVDEQLSGERLRVVILDWNARSLAAYRRAGFRDVGTHTNEEGTYLLLTRPRP